MRYYKDGYVGGAQQIYTLRRTAIMEGPAAGMGLIEIANSGGLQIDVLPEAGLDLGIVRYKGTLISWISKNGYVSRSLSCASDNHFPNKFPGGLMYTCGLRSTGGACLDNGEWHPTHGRYHDMAADNVSCDERDGEIVVRGVIRETALFGHALEVRRTIRVPVDGASIMLEDELSNLTPKPEEYTLLYHCNFGWPFISEQAELVLSDDRVTKPRTPWAEGMLGKECTFSKPVPGEEERVYFHENTGCTALLRNQAMGLSVRLSWSDNLPILAHWRSMASGDYVCGLEPTNNYIMGRTEERNNGTLPVIQPFETLRTSLRFDFCG